MSTDSPDDRLTILERAHLLHDATLRRHGDMLDAHEDARVQHKADLAHLTALADRQQQLQADVHVLMAGLLQRQDDQTARLERHAERVALLESLVVRLDAARAQHEERMDRLQQTLDAIKDLLNRGNGQ
jgi:chromosome segregation ATPase